jgi:poly(3-hydroxybutyrate) depolymerase
MPVATATYPFYMGADQPPRRSLDISHIVIAGDRVPVTVRDVLETPFFALTEFRASGGECRGDVLVVAPLSGHLSLLLRDLVIGLLSSYRVYVTDWINVRHVAAEHGSFGLDENIAGVALMIEQLGSGVGVVALCQGGIAALAATAALAAARPRCLPGALVLIAVPVDPLADPPAARGGAIARSRRLSRPGTDCLSSARAIGVAVGLSAAPNRRGRRTAAQGPAR